MSDRANLVRVLTTSTGTSTMTLGTAYSQLFMTPSEAGMMDGRTYTYLIVDGNNWELGKGVYTTSGNTLSRVTVLASRISGTIGTTKITLSGTAQVRIVESADDMGALRGTRAVTGTSDAIANTDLGRAIAYSNAGAIAATIAQAGAGGQFLDGWSVHVKNTGAGTLTITPATSTINGGASLALAQNMGAFIWSDGTNYHAYFFPVTKPLLAANNLSDLASAATARSNLQAYPQQTIQNILQANGGCEVWQIGTSVAIAASATAHCGPDRFWLGTGASQASTVSRQAGIVNGSRYSAKVQRNSGQTGTGTMIFEYPLISDEVVRAQQAGGLALSFTAKAGANFSPTSGALTVTVYQGTDSPRKRGASAYTSESAVISTTFNLTTTAAQFLVIGVALSVAATAAAVSFTWTPTGTAGADDSFTIDDLRLDTVPTGATVANFVPPVEHLDHGAYFLACRQVYRQSYVEGTAPGTITQTGRISYIAPATGGEALPAYPYTPSMWRAPAGVTYSPDTGAGGAIRNASGSADVGGTLVTLTIDGHASWSASHVAGNVYWYHYTADARL